ncbi:amino acid/polyamine/organocation transporter, APC superfamily [Gemmobacter megaterium]|uniref:Amino acid/polyamine/organocation transporter, APC superfamily n=1 Tax=Gemmobacter megaterium TaxID=1086013 RepID=A0A1N7PGX1_9RHOB|nr:APC family permease [Gemmobacter megaterium]GGE18455.1 amino acid permease [Gemmobacter megaterium]SIT09579.1 amino acid/polyamine/organocation transporter, APC superfamily [Gemmobacter megaterium]
MADAPINQLKKNSLGVGAVTFLVVSAAAPLTGSGGGVPPSMLFGNGAGIAASFVVVTLILLAFSVGYVAMSRHVKNAGAFYAFTAQGLGGRMGGAAAMIAILAYNGMQIGLIGLFGAVASGTGASFGLELPWWVWAYAAIVLVGIMGYRQVDLSAKVLMVLVLAEFAIVLLLDAAILTSGGAEGLSLAPFSWENLTSGTPSIGILFCFAAFIGFEATTIYSEEARNPAKTVPQATYISVLAIGCFYIVTSWLMIMGVGVDNLLPTLEANGPDSFLFDLSGRYLGEFPTLIMAVLFVTSIFAAVLAFHNAVARYKFVAGREGILPDRMGTTHALHLSPHMGSVAQTVLALVVVTVFVVLERDPVLELFVWLTQMGTLGILGLMALSSFAIVAFFKRDAMGEGMVSTTILPILSGLVMAGLFVKIFMDFGALTGASGVLAVAIPGLIPVLGLVGYLLALKLSRRDPARFADLGKAKF